MTYVSARALSLALPLALALGFAVGCDDPGENDSESDTDGNDDHTDTDGEPGECVQNPAKPTLVSIDSLDDDPFPDLDATCSLLSADHDGTDSTLEISCPTDAGSNRLAIHVVGDALPGGLVVGESYEFHLQRSNEIGSAELDLILSDADGPIVAAIDHSPERVTWGPFSLRFATYCPQPDEPDGPGVDGYVLFSSEDIDTDVFVGSPETLTVDAMSWTAYAGSASDSCCHGSSFSAALVRL